MTDLYKKKVSLYLFGAYCFYLLYIIFFVLYLGHDKSWLIVPILSILAGVYSALFKRDDVDDLAVRIDKWFETNGQKRDEVRRACMKEIDEEWNPYFQLDVLKKNLK